MQGQLAKYEANLRSIVDWAEQEGIASSNGLNKRDCIVEWEEAKIHERLNRHRYDIWEKDKVIQGIDRRVGIQAHEIESLKEQVSYL